MKKEITVLDSVPSTITEARKIKITDESSMTKAVEVLSVLNKKAKEIKAERELITKPMNEALAEVRGRYKPTEDALSALIESIRKEMTAYQTEQARIESESKKKIDDKVASGRMKLETGLAKREEIQVAPDKITSSAGKVAFREVECFEVDNIAKVPKEYLLPNETMIRNAMKAGIKIEGVRYFTEQRPVNRVV